jgi:hypothetical protein
MFNTGYPLTDKAMKKYLYIITVLLAFTSCKKFLDVKPASQIEQDQLFENEQGFKEALNGVYTLCAGQSLYGGNLTFGHLDIMAQNYDFTNAGYSRIAAFDYAYPDLINRNTDIWNSGYRAIANCNYILSNIDQKKGLFTGHDYELIKGEALALRAYLHFDILRMFGPSYKSNPNFKAIPYVTKVTTQSTKFSTVSQAIDSIITDLKASRTLLRTSDPIVAGYTVGYPDDLGNPEVSNPDLFMQNRRHRMNYFTTCGELARVYLYKNDMPNALAMAEEVILSKRFPATNGTDFNESDVTKKDRIFYKELISCWYINDNKDIKNYLIGTFAGTAPAFSATSEQIDDIYESATAGADDWRYKQWFFKTKIGSSSTERAVLLKYLTNISPVKNLHPQVAPALRLSEMYYIAAEAAFNTDPLKALDYFNTARHNRGIGYDLRDIPTKADFLETLITEARKEFYGESQIFYMYKRLNHTIKSPSGLSYPATDKIFVFPLPQDEEAFRNN